VADSGAADTLARDQSLVQRLAGASARHAGSVSTGAARIRRLARKRLAAPHRSGA